MSSFCISAVASNQGKTILTTALLYHFRKSVRPYKIGPDYIDPQFHKVVSQTNSINLDSFIMNESQVQWLYNKYNNKKTSILEGVMGFYDGDNKGCSAYSVTKLLNIPTILLLDASGSYITISAVLKGLIDYKSDNTIKAIVLNKVSSTMHYELIKNQVEKDHPNIIVLGWIKKNLSSLQDTHLGLDLNNLTKIKQISKDILEYIDLEKLNTLKLTSKNKKINDIKYPFKKLKKNNKTIAVVTDKNFSFLYHDNLVFLKEVFKKVIIIDSTKNEPIPKNCDIVYICGGYVETNQAYKNIKKSKLFRDSLVKHSKTKNIYAECAGLLYLGKKVDDKKMSGILDVSFVLDTKFNRLGYYYNQSNIKGHSFHYTKAIDTSNGHDILSKIIQGKGINGSWESKDKKVFGTYLHTMFRNNTKLIKKKFL